MTENTGIPKHWPETVNSVSERLIVPCDHNAAVFKARGVRVPISVVPGGTEPGEFPVLRPRSRPYTFMALADRPPRKGMELVWSAFYKAFPTEDVRLIIKARPSTLSWLNTYNFTDRRVSFWKLDVDSLADVFAHVDCFVFPSFGEGWGMPPREAAMMGLPVIATRWSGLEVGIDQWAIPLERYTLAPAQPADYKGEWAVPDLDEVIEKMRWCYDNQDAARAKGMAAAQWLRQNQTWEHSAQALVDLMEKYA
jgi:glycosyltransferase involved in cell wall biosynthesis